MRHSVNVGLSLVVGVCLAMIVLMPGHAATRAAPHPSVSAYFGVAPANCAVASPRLIHRDRRTGSTWAGTGALRANSGWYIVNGRLALGFGARTRYGYPQKIFWQLINGSHGSVTVTGWNARTGRRIWFGRPAPGRPAGASVPLVAWPAAVVRPHRAPTLTFVPSAGCYILQAHWKGGSWRVPFTAGG